MLELKNIRKIYETGDTTLAALDGVSLCFRENEFVSILGPSGCGKTTLLNIVGGLDRYSEGDLVINGRSTKLFKDKDWDAYRNHSIGFVFQSYNLIPHQTVLANVELALTLSGVSKSERRAKATEALKKVGLGDQLHKKPNQMSGGQMQRVAIARALVNNPDILLADEPTGALDTQTSVQIMDLLKEVANDRLVIMVTHNPELAEQYSTRIVRFSDGKVVGDTNPITDEEYVSFVAKDEAAIIEAKKDKKLEKARSKKKSMSFGTAIALSFKNLLTKKGRTILTSFAGSIGIIGIALILALSNGINLFITQVQEDTLSTYPLSIQQETSDTSAMLSAMTNVEESDKADRDPNKIYVDDSMGNMINAMLSTRPNNLEKFKGYIDENYDEKLAPYVSDIQYTYDLKLQTYSIIPVLNDDGVEENRVTKLGLGSMLDNMGESFSGMSSLISASGMLDVMSEMIDNQELLDQQYELVTGNWPKEENEIVLVVSKDNQLSRMTLYMLGLLDQDDLEGLMKELMENKEVNTEPVEPYTFEELMGTNIVLVNTPDLYTTKSATYKIDGSDKEYPIWVENPDYTMGDIEKVLEEKGIKLKIAGIIRPRVDATASSISTPLAYTSKLTDKMLKMTSESEIIKQQKETPDYNVLTGLKFERTHYTPENINELIDKVDNSTMQQFYGYMTQMILSNPEFSDRINVTKDSFAQMFFLMPVEKQAEIMSAILATDGVKNAPAAMMPQLDLFNIVSMAAPDKKVTVTKDNIVTLLPVLEPAQIYVALTGVQKSEQMPFAVAGLVSLAGDEAMSKIYTDMTESIKTMTITEDIFVALLSTMKENDKDFIMLEETLYEMATDVDATYDNTMEKLGYAYEASPASINFYAKDFASKEQIEQFISDYNDTVEDEDTIEYTDLVGALMSSVTIIIDVISYVLIAFVSISLVVSSIMIGIITNISVLERTKEIGILRAIGASKKDVSRVFNAETFIIGLIAGLLGILITLLLCIPANAIIYALTGFANVKAVLPPVAAIILVLISMGLTMLAGIIPARSASKKDPVVALRTE